MTKSYYKNGQKKIGYEKLLENCSDCTIEVLEAKNNYFLKMTTKLQYQRTAAKTYWAALSRLLYKKDVQKYYLYLLVVNLLLFFLKKQIFLITILRQNVHQ